MTPSRATPVMRAADEDRLIADEPDLERVGQVALTSITFCLMPEMISSVEM